MPSYLHIRDVDPPLSAWPDPLRARLKKAGVEYPSEADAFHTVTTLREVLTKLASFTPSVACRVLTRGDCDSLTFETWSIEGRSIHEDRVELSTQSNEPWEDAAPLAHEVSLELDVDADALSDELESAAEEGDFVVGEKGSLRLPFTYRRLDVMAKALALVAGHLKGDAVRVVTEIDAQFFLAILDRKKGVALSPLWLFHPRKAHRAWVQKQYPRAKGRFPPVRPRRLAASWQPSNPEQSWLTGSARSRRDALIDRLSPPVVHRLGGMSGTTHTHAVRDAKLFAELTGVVSAVENRGEKFAPFRADLYGTIAEYTTAEATQFLVNALHHEPEAGRIALYELLSRRDSEDACKAVVFGWRAESTDVARAIGPMLWRQRRAVELCVRALVASWDEDPKFATRSLSMLRRECIKVDRAWLLDASAAASKALEPLIAC